MSDYSFILRKMVAEGQGYFTSRKGIIPKRRAGSLLNRPLNLETQAAGCPTPDLFAMLLAFAWCLTTLPHERSNVWRVRRPFSPLISVSTRYNVI